MKIQIVGGGGFIGTNLGRNWEEHTLINIDKSAVNLDGGPMKVADLRAPIPLSQSMSPSDWLILLAAEHRDDVTPVSLYHDVNVEGVKNILNKVDKFGITKLLFTSSVAVYGLNKENPTEEHPVDPFNYYGKSKFEAEELLREWYLKAPLQRTLIIIRPTVVFGPNNRGNVYNLLRQIATGKFIMIGSGNNKKSMSFIENITGFIKYCIDQNMSGYQLFNYSDKPDLTTKQLVNHSQKLLEGKISNIRIPYVLGYAAGLGFDFFAWIMGRKFPISSVRVKKFCATTQFDASKIATTGYVPKFSIEEGIDITIDSIKKEEELLA
jgi:nucleoside-diphosphate-sugar epimerase